MVDGFQNKKVAFIIQARMQSTRLPGKILMPMPFGNGKPLISWIIDELKQSTLNSKIIVATSLNAENDVLESFCDLIKIGCFRGDEENVLSRFTAISQREDFECIVRLTADNPILDINILERIVNHHLENDNDYTSTDALPTGMNIEVMSSKALLDIENHNISDADREHVTLFIRNSGKYKTELFNPEIRKELKSLRLTVDYASDFALLSMLLSISLINELSGIKLIESAYSNYNWLFETNQGNIQKKQIVDLDQELNEAIGLLKKYDFNNAAQILKNHM